MYSYQYYLGAHTSELFMLSTIHKMLLMMDKIQTTYKCFGVH